MVCGEIFIQQSCETVDTVHKLDSLKLEIYLIRTEFEPRVERGQEEIRANFSG